MENTNMASYMPTLKQSAPGSQQKSSNSQEPSNFPSSLVNSYVVESSLEIESRSLSREYSLLFDSSF